MKLIPRPVAVSCVLAALLAGPLATPGHAEAPTAQGWWSIAHQGVQPPAPPDVPEDGLLVQGGAARPVAPGAPTPGGTPAVAATTQALSALTFVLPAGAAVESLVLKLVGDPPASTTAFACPVTGPYEAVQNGEYGKRPSFDCLTNAVPVLDPVAGTLTFGSDLTGIVRGRSLSFVLLPGEADRLVLQKPGATALVLRRSTGSSGPGTTPLNPGPPPPQGPAASGRSVSAGPPPASGVGTSGPPLGSSPGLGTGSSPPASPAVAPAVPAPVLGGPRTGPTTTAGPVPVDGSNRALLLVALLAVGAVLVLSTRPAASPSARAAAPLAVPQERGIGRFRTTRDHRAVPL